MWESKFTTERAWTGGPLRKVGTGNGTPSKYVCEKCEKSTPGVWHKGRTWICSSCWKTQRLSRRALGALGGTLSPPEGVSHLNPREIEQETAS